MIKVHKKRCQSATERCFSTLESGSATLKVHVPYFPKLSNSGNFHNFTTLQSCESCPKLKWTFSWWVTDEMIQRAIYSTRDTLGQVLEFVAELDERQVPRSYGYFVELEGELGVCYTLAWHPSTRFKLTSNFQDLILTLLHAKCKRSSSRIQGTRCPLTTEGLVCPPSEFLLRGRLEHIVSGNSGWRDIPWDKSKFPPLLLALQWKSG